MAHTGALVEALKRELRSRKLTYAHVAKHLAMSEASVKRMFSRNEFTLERIDKICECLGMEFSDVARSVASPQAALSRLTEQQERELAADPKLMLAALCALNQVPFGEVLRTYELSEAECVRLFARLDRLRFLELMPGNRYRLLVSRAFAWIPDGPIQRLFKQWSADYFRSHFAGANELLVLVNGMLSRSSVAAVLERLKRVAAEFAEMRIDDAQLPSAERVPLTLLVAARPWEPEVLGRLRRLRRSAPR